MVLGYNGPSHTADCISAQFSGNREAARILDVACGTGNVAKEVKSQQQSIRKHSGWSSPGKNVYECYEKL